MSSSVVVVVVARRKRSEKARENRDCQSALRDAVRPRSASRDARVDARSTRKNMFAAIRRARARGVAAVDAREARVVVARRTRDRSRRCADDADEGDARARRRGGQGDVSIHR